jgi:ABC-type glycerol-3-phosphate transport system substrate-binding protein
MQIVRKSFIASFVLTLILSACAPSTTTESTNTPRPSVTENSSAKATATPEGSRLNVEEEALRGARVTIWHPWFGAEATLFESQVAQFNTDNEWGIILSAEGKNNFNELYSETDAALEDSANPNMVVALPEYAVEWQAKVVDLNPYVGDPIFGISSLEISDFPSVIWLQDVLNGKRLGMPAQRTARFIIYNRTWARELGFDSPPKTSSEFERQACAAHNALGKDDDENNNALGGWLIDDHAMTSLSWMLAFDGGVQEEDGYRFLSPGNIDAFKFLKIMQQKGCAWVPSNEGVVYDRFASRRALFATLSMEEFVDQARAFTAVNNSDEWAVLPFPGTDTTAFAVYGSSFVMFESDDVTQLAGWLFLRWMLSAQNQARWVQSTNLFPLRSSTMDLLGDYSSSHPQWMQAVELLPAGKTTPKLSSWRIVKIMMEDGFRDMFDTIRHPDLTDGQVPLVLKQMEETADELHK